MRSSLASTPLPPGVAIDSEDSDLPRRLITRLGPHFSPRHANSSEPENQRAQRERSQEELDSGSNEPLLCSCHGLTP